ncbi:MAG: tetratricopeptide repeat protein [Alphaproteobacteria bacterium]
MTKGASNGLQAVKSKWAAAAVVFLMLPLVACAGGRSSGIEARGVEVARAGAPVEAGASAYGNYLAARHAGFARDLDVAADLLVAALERDPDESSVLSLTHRILLAQGRVDEAVGVARHIIAQGAESAFAPLTLALDDIGAGRLAPAMERLKNEEQTSVNRVLIPIINAWSLAGLGRFDDALAALDPLGRVRGFVGLRDLHRALILDLSERDGDARAAYAKLVAKMTRPSARLVEVIGNFHERAGAPEAARDLYRRYRKTRPDSLLFEAGLADDAPTGKPPRLVVSAGEGVSEALFHFAGALHERSATDAALVYIRLALHMRSDFPAARMLLADLLETLRRFAEANEVYAGIGAASEFRWSARIRAAENLHELGRTDEAVARLAALGAERPARIDALARLGSILRTEERYEEAVDVYDRIISRVGEVERRHWVLLYARGIALERSQRWKRAEADLLRALDAGSQLPWLFLGRQRRAADRGAGDDRTRGRAAAE